MSETPLPKTLLEAVTYFSDLDRATEFVAKLRWPQGPVCPRCGAMEHSYITTRRLWKCKACKKQFSVKVGTIIEDSPLGLNKWLPAVWLIANSKNGISSHELARALGVTQKSTWFMLHRIRLAMQTGTFEKFGGQVEVDETFIGGKARNMHKHVRARRVAGATGGNDPTKTKVLGMIERGGTVRVAVVPALTRDTVHDFVRRGVESGSDLYTDKGRYYIGLGKDYAHETVDHAVAYVDGQVHTNFMENFWSVLKRGLHGTYISVQPYHLFRYLDERVFTFQPARARRLRALHERASGRLRSSAHVGRTNREARLSLLPLLVGLFLRNLHELARQLLEALKFRTLGYLWSDL